MFFVGCVEYGNGSTACPNANNTWVPFDFDFFNFTTTAINYFLDNSTETNPEVNVDIDETQGMF